MPRVMFICHGNICRSTMAEFLLKHMVRELGVEDQFVINSCGTSREEIGNPVHPGTIKRLKQVGVFVGQRGAVQLKSSDYDDYDYLLCMDDKNLRNALRTVGVDSNDKMLKLLEFTEQKRDIADPWYTGNYDETFDDIYKGLLAFLRRLGYLELGYDFFKVTK